MFEFKFNNAKGKLQFQEGLRAREVLYKSSECKERHPLGSCFAGVNVTLLKSRQMLTLQTAAWGSEAFFAFQLFDVALMLEVPAQRALPAEGIV